MQTYIKKPPLGRTASENAYSNFIRKYPPYGKKLENLRRRNLVPTKRIIITTDWSIGKLYPRIIVTPDTPVSNLQFNYLSGLHVQIVYFDRDEPILSDLITEILSIQPATLATFNMSAVKRGEPAFKLIYSHSVMEVA